MPTFDLHDHGGQSAEIILRLLRQFLCATCDNMISISIQKLDYYLVVIVGVIGHRGALEPAAECSCYDTSLIRSVKPTGAVPKQS
jgi:hypothetical protein